MMAMMILPINDDDGDDADDDDLNEKEGDDKDACPYLGHFAPFLQLL